MNTENRENKNDMHKSIWGSKNFRIKTALTISFMIAVMSISTVYAGTGESLSKPVSFVTEGNTELNQAIDTGDVLPESEVPEVIDVEDAWEPLDYSQSENWISFSEGENKDVDVFWICPTISANSITNIADNEPNRKLFEKEYKRESGIYSETGRMFAPFYREMSLQGYLAPTREKCLQDAYKDVSAAFEYYLKNENKGRGIILAGFSQGSDMCYRLLEEYFGNDSEESAQLRKSLVAVYGIGWAITEKMVEENPQIVPAKGEFDTGVVVSFECEDDRVETISSNLIIPKGIRMLSINPLNWKTDSTKADKSLNLGSMVTNADKTVSMISAYCGAYIDSKRGCLKVTDLTEKMNFLAALGYGSLHLYDFSLFYMNLKKNVADRTAAFIKEANKKEDDTVANITKVSHTFSAGENVSMNMTYTSAVSYNGKKHVSNFEKTNNGRIGDITVSVDSTLLSFADLKVKSKNNKNVSADTSKNPEFIVSFKTKKGMDKDKKKLIKAVNKELKKMPFKFSINAADLSKAKKVEPVLNGAKNKVKRVTAVFDDLTLKLGKKDFDAKINSDGSVTLKGKRNFSGEVTIR